MSVVFTLKGILGLIIFVFGGNKERKNGAHNVVDVAIYHGLKNWVIPFRYERNIEYIYNMIWCWRFCSKTNYFVPNGLDVSDLIEYASIILNIGSDNVLIFAGCDDMYPVAFYCELLNWDVF